MNLETNPDSQELLTENGLGFDVTDDMLDDVIDPMTPDVDDDEGLLDFMEGLDDSEDVIEERTDEN